MLTTRPHGKAASLSNYRKSPACTGSIYYSEIFVSVAQVSLTRAKSMCIRNKN